MKHFCKSLVFLLSLVLTASLFLAGCGAKTDESSTGPATPSLETGSFDVSKLLTREEAATILGEAVNPAKITLPDITPAQGHLLFFDTASANGNYLQVGVIPDSAELAAINQTAELLYTTTRDQIVQNGISVEGIGDEAVWGTKPNFLYILKEPYYITIAVSGNGDATADFELAKKVAALISPRLP